MLLRSIVRKLLPQRLTNNIGGLLVAHRERQLSQLPLDEAFDAVYRRGMWKQGRSLSGLGSEGSAAEMYAAIVRDYAATHNLRSVLDAGCGDFSVGALLAGGFESYTAIDVSPHIIEIDKRRYSGAAWRHVEFAAVDLTTSQFPPADLVLIRQVLQHLTNSQIERILRNLEASTWRRALITEDVHDLLKIESPNVDLPSHSVRTRRSLRSGVFIDRPPFSRRARRLEIIPTPENDGHDGGGLLVFELLPDRAL